MEKRSFLVISLDFELYWGMRDIVSIEDYKENLLGVRRAIPRLLEIFQEFNIHATWATVGFLFCNSKKQLLGSLPVIKPNYAEASLSPYSSIENVGENEREDPFHYGASLIQEILNSPNQEIGTHTFSHYYCLEEGQNVESFQEDLQAAIDIGNTYHLNIKSLVFPRNQYSAEYLSICNKLGIMSFRGNESSWIYHPCCLKKKQSRLKRIVRLLDAYTNISGHHSYPIENIETNSLPINIPSSRFLRPYNKRAKIFESLRLQRILSSLTFAAKHQQIYHLWWHPHNFGADLEENMLFLRKILLHYQKLRNQYNMESSNMGELANLLYKEGE